MLTRFPTSCDCEKNSFQMIRRAAERLRLTAGCASMIGMICHDPFVKHQLETISQAKTFLQIDQSRALPPRVGA